MRLLLFFFYFLLVCVTVIYIQLPESYKGGKLCLAEYGSVDVSVIGMYKPKLGRKLSLICNGAGNLRFIGKGLGLRLDTNALKQRLTPCAGPLLGKQEE